MMLQLRRDEAGRFEPFPLTEMQQAYWLGRSQEFELGGVGIHFYEELECCDLDTDRLGRSWQEVISGHDALRTVILSDGRQRVLNPASEYRIREVDLTGLPLDDVQARLTDIRQRLSHRLYALEEWPCFELLACRVDGGQTRLCISMDLTHLDLHGLGLVFRDWIQGYLQPEYRVPAAPVRFRDYSIALQHVQASESYLRARKWWSDVLKAMPPAPSLPFARPPAAVSRPRFERRCGTVAQAEWDRVKASAARQGITPSCLALAAYCDVIRLWSTEPAFTVNIALRNNLAEEPGMGEVAGMFTSAAPVAAIESTAPFLERAQTLQKRMWDLLRHRIACGVDLLREYGALNGKRASEAILPVVYTSSLGVAPHPLLELEKLGRRVWNLIQTPQVCLDLQIFERGSEFVFHWDTIEGLFPRGVADDMCNAYGNALASLASETAWTRAVVAGLPEEQRQRRRAVNATEAPRSGECLDQFCWGDAQSRAERAAVITSKKTIRYGQLHEAAQELAARIRRAGVKPGELVAITMEKGWEQFAAVHATLMAGAAYVPIAPELPDSRRESLLRNAEARMVLTTRRWQKRLSWPGGIRLICIEDEVRDSECEEAFPRSADSLAYVMYTSGSTGEPKGVMIRHSSVVNRLADINRRFGIGPDDRMFAITALQHDLSVFDLFGTIAAGAAAVTPDAGKTRDPAHWAEMMRQHGVTVWNSVPAFLEMLVTYLESGGASVTPTLRLVLLAGDWIPVSLPGRLRALVPGAKVVSLGGPTETTVWDIHYPIDEVDPAWTSIPYGTPLQNSRYYVMNRHLEERPDWVGGEMYIGGAGLAQGYWKDPEKTRQRFLEHPETGERLYRSGDLGRYLPDGNVEFLGRADSQLKISGLRIEAGEVASAIRRHPAVMDAVVRATGSRDRGRTLTAYVIPAKRVSGYEANGTMLSEQANLVHRLGQPGLLRTSGHGPAIALSDHRNGNGHAPVSEYGRRRSYRVFSGEAPRESFNGLLSKLRGIPMEDGPVLPKYLYPSAGSLYPVRAYVCIKAGAVAGVPQGSYYYHPMAHDLRLVSTDVPDSTAQLEHNRCLADSSGFLIVLAAHLPAIEPVYGKLARDFCLLEAGYMGQLLMMSAGEYGLGLCPIGDLDRRRLGAALHLGPEDEIVHSLAGGIPSRIAAGNEAASCVVDKEARWRREILDLVKQSLPEEMAPRSIVFLQTFPIGRNGKVDLEALPEPNEDRGEPIEPPATERERELAALLAEVLEASRVCVERKFMEQGCNSIQLVRFMVRLQTTLGSPVTISDLFTYPSIRLLAQYLDRGSVSGPGESAVHRASLRLQLRGANGR
jgi:epothilone synthetase B